MRRSHAIVLLLVALGLAMAVRRSHRPRRHALTTANPRAIRNEAVGIAVDDHGLYIENWGAWFDFAPQAIEDAVAAGVVGADGVLNHVLRRALPRLPWPPPPESPLANDWRSMVKIVAESLNLEPEPHPGSRLRLVT